MLLSAALEREASAEQRRFRLKRLANFLEDSAELRVFLSLLLRLLPVPHQDLDFRKCHRLYETQTNPISLFLPVPAPEAQAACGVCLSTGPAGGGLLRFTLRAAYVRSWTYIEHHF